MLSPRFKWLTSLLSQVSLPFGIVGRIISLALLLIIGISLISPLPAFGQAAEKERSVDLSAATQVSIRSNVLPPCPPDESNEGGPVSPNASNTAATSNALPTTPMLHLVPSSDTGISNSDHLTGNNMPAFTGQEQAGMQILIFDGNNLIGYSKTNSSRDWNFALDICGALSDGSHAIRAQAVNATGQTSALSPVLAVMIDTNPPAMPLIRSIGKGYALGGQVTISGTAGANTQIRVFEGSTNLVTTRADAQGSWSVTQRNVSAGKHTYRASAIDAAGNESPSFNDQTVIMDTNNSPGNTSLSSNTNTSSQSPPGNSSGGNSKKASPTPTATRTLLPTNTSTATATALPSSTPTATNTATALPSSTQTATNTPLPSDTPTSASTPTLLPTDTPVPTSTVAVLPTDTAMNTATATATATNAPLPTDIPTATNTSTPLPTDTPTYTATPIQLPTNTPANTATPTPLTTDTPTIIVQATSTSAPTNTSTPTQTATASPTALPVIAMAAGDIACGTGSSGDCQQLSTSNLLVNQSPNIVMPLGDNQYECGSLSDFNTYYSPSWGRVLPQTYPSIGNHEYQTSTDATQPCYNAPTGAPGYFTYFGNVATPNQPGCTVNCNGYYSYDAGAWHIIVLNSVCSQVGGCGLGSPEETWLKNDLAVHPNFCTLAYWHYPRYTSGLSGTTFLSGLKAFWQDLYNGGVDIILNGHDHDYERFAPMDVNGNLDTSHGIREFVIGTGGKSHQSFTTIAANSQVRNSDNFGVMKLTLNSGNYSWQFVPVSGKTFTDSGSESCR